MATCSKCGSQLEDGQLFCSSCGAPVKEAQTAQQTETPKIDISEKIQNLANSGEDKTADFDKTDIESNKVMAVLAYFGILVLVPILAAKDSRFARFHANQGLILFLASIILSFVGSIPVIGWLVSLVGGIAILVLGIMGIIAAAKGEAKTLPVIGKFVLIK